ncbi:MAG: AmmeMemoRadiSam system protein B [Balneolaceae bacterium]
MKSPFKDRPIPPLRRDIELIPITDDGQELIYVYDSMQYVEQGFALDQSVAPILSLLTGTATVQSISKALNGQLETEDLEQFFHFLDEHLLLDSTRFRTLARQVEERYEKKAARPLAFAGQSYPADREEFKAFQHGYFDQLPLPERSNLFALYAPHIDLKLGKESYRRAFAHLHHTKPERVVILATSHYAGMYPETYNHNPFIGTYKNFKLPGRTIYTDKNAIHALAGKSDELGFTTHDRAHRIEHSIELHLALATHFWPHDFTLVPILVGSFDELLYADQGDLHSKVDAFGRELATLDDGKTFFLISGDLSHIGRKFGDQIPADQMKEDVQNFDQTFLTLSRENRPGAIVDLMKEEYDPYRICGFPPLYTFLNAFPSTLGSVIHYDWWDEAERESAVSFAAISYS